MPNYHPDYVKEKAKFNYELIKIFSVLFITVAVGTFSELKAIDFDQGIKEITQTKVILISGGTLFLAGILGFILYYVVTTNNLLKMLNENKEL